MWVGRNCVCASLVNKENKNCEVVSLDGAWSEG